MSVARLHTHLDRLEAESVRIIRETVAECRKPVLLYSVGKDSSVLLHLMLKAFYPALPLCEYPVGFHHASCIQRT